MYAKITSSTICHIFLDPSASSESSPSSTLRDEPSGSDSNENQIEGLTFPKFLLIISTVKKLFVSISSSFSGLFVYLFSTLPAFATPVVNPCTSPSNNPISEVFCRLGGGGGENIGTTVRGVVVFFIILAVLVALLYLLYGGVKWITSKGDKAEVEAARNHIVAAIVGLIVVILAVFILTIILAAFGIRFDQLKIPVIGT